MIKQLIPTIFFLITLFAQAQQNNSIKLATWNMEHLAENNGEGCVPRHDSDYFKLRDFAKTLKADVVALQEVESVKAVARVFPEKDWHIIVSDRPASESYECYGNKQNSTQQRVGLAIRKGTAFKKVGTFKALGLDEDGLRYGLMIQLILDADTLDVMAVHLKSGCFVDDYSKSDREACDIFERQVPVLDTWVETRIKNNRPFVIMGDFNHRLANSENKLWKMLTEMDEQMVVIKNSMQNLESCHPKYPAPIDHILMGAGAEKLYKPESETVFYYSETPETMQKEDMLSDHCPISVTLQF